MNNVLIRPATIADFDAIYDFILDLTSEYFDKSLLRQCYETCLDTSNTHYLVATVGDNTIGYLSCHGQVLLHHCALVYEIQEMYVLAPYRSLGAGKLLLEALEERVNNENYAVLEVCSNMKRKDAHRFYETNGFTLTTYKFKKMP